MSSSGLAPSTGPRNTGGRGWTARSSFATLLGPGSQRERLAEAWEGVLFNQFHDIICGSHVDKVYANVIDRYKSSAEIAGRCRDAALAAIAEHLDTSGEGIPIIVFNPL